MVLCNSIAHGQQAETYPDEVYIKLRTNQNELDASKPQLQLDNASGIKNYLPLNKSNDPRNQSSYLNGLYRVKLEPGSDITSFCEELKAYQNVHYVEPIYREQLLYTPNDPAITNENQYYLSVIKAFEAWDVTQGSSEIVIGISDTGFDRDHQDINAKIYRNVADPPNGIDDDNNGYVDDFLGYDFADNDSIAEADNSDHGNRVGGVAGANTDNSLGIAGVGFNTLISPLKVFRSSNNASNSAYESVIYAADNNFDIINLSWGSANTYSQAAQDIINYAVEEKGLIVIAAAGNTPEDLPFYPASYDNVLSVAATEPDDSKASFSTFNYNVDMVAPGREVYSTNKNNGYGIDGGTSYSSPMVAGAAALVKHQFPDLTANQIQERLRVSATSVYHIGANTVYQDKLGYGRLDIYNALTNDTLKSIRLKGISYANEIDNIAYHGDSITVSGLAINYLNPSSGTLTLSSQSPYIDIANKSVALGSLNALSENTFVSNNIIYIHENTPPETTIDVRVNIQDGGYQDFQYFSIVTEPDRVDIESEKIQYTITGNGNLAFGTDGFLNGLGLNWNDQVLAGRVSFMIGSSSASVSDNFYNNTVIATRDHDFSTYTPGKLERHSSMNLLASNTFSDNAANNPLGMVVIQKTMTNEEANYLIHEYRLSNATENATDYLTTGWYVDWSIQNAAKNKTYYDDNLRMLISFDSDSSAFSGLYIYRDDAPIAQGIDIGSQNGNEADLEGDLTENIKYQLSKNTLYDSAGWSGDGNDVAAMISTDSIIIDATKSERVALFMLFGNSVSDLLNALDSASGAYEQYLTEPKLLETVTSCEGAPIQLNPSKGDQYRFYSDPLGQNLIGTGDTLMTGRLDQDTSFYLVNIDAGFEEDIERIDVQLVAKVANFSMSTDTLYLDNPTNSVQFTDLSFRPASWLWDFGNSLQATVQNPVVSYSEAGLYEITLNVDNELGCSESTVKSLLVVERPPMPDISNSTVCEGESVDLEATNTNSISVYRYPSDKTPVHTGSSLQLSNLLRDTTVYITNASEPFESLKKEVTITVLNFHAQFRAIPDIRSSATAANFINVSNDYITSKWYVDGSYVTNQDTLPLVVLNSTYLISLVTTNAHGCSDSTTQSVTFQNSPIPSVVLETICHGADVVVQPENGTFFGFYADENLTQLLKKGTSLFISSLTNETDVFIVGLDSILPSTPFNLTITPVLPSVDIHADPDTLYLNQAKTTQFYTENDQIISWSWHLNGLLIESSPNPLIFLDSAGTYEVVLLAIDENGCTNSDTLRYMVLNAPVIDALGEKLSGFKIYPVPAGDYLTIETQAYESVQVINLSGEVLLESPVNGKVQLETIGLNRGLYFIKLIDGNQAERWVKVVLR